MSTNNENEQRSVSGDSGANPTAPRKSRLISYNPILNSIDPEQGQGQQDPQQSRKSQGQPILPRKSRVVETIVVEHSPIDLDKEVDRLVAVAREQCDRQKAALKKKYEQDIEDLKKKYEVEIESLKQQMRDKLMQDAKGSCDQEFLEPLRKNLQSSQEEITRLKTALENALSAEKENKKLAEDLKIQNESFKQELQQAKEMGFVSGGKGRRSSDVGRENDKLGKVVEKEHLLNQSRMKIRTLQDIDKEDASSKGNIEEIRKLKEENEELKNKLKLLQDKSANENLMKCDGQSKKLQEQVEQMSAMEAETKKLMGNISALEAEIIKLKEQLDKMSALEADLRKQLEKMSDLEAQTKKQQEELKRMAELEAETKKLQEQVEKMATLEADLRKQEEQLKKITALEEETTILKKQLEEMSALEAETKKQREELQKMYALEETLRKEELERMSSIDIQTKQQKEQLEKLAALEVETKKQKEELEKMLVMDTKMKKQKEQLEEMSAETTNLKEGQRRMSASEEQNKSLVEGGRKTSLIPVPSGTLHCNHTHCQRTDQFSSNIGTLQYDPCETMMSSRMPRFGADMDDRDRMALRKKVQLLEKRVEQLVNYVDRLQQGQATSKGAPITPMLPLPSTSPQTAPLSPDQAQVVPANQNVNAVLDKLCFLEETLDIFNRRYEQQMGALENSMRMQDENYRNALGHFSTDIRTIKTLLANDPSMPSTIRPAGPDEC